MLVHCRKDQLQTNHSIHCPPLLHPLPTATTSHATRGGEEVEESGMKLNEVETGKKGGLGKAILLSFCFSLSYSISNSQQMKIIFPNLSLFCPQSSLVKDLRVLSL